CLVIPVENQARRAHAEVGHGDPTGEHGHPVVTAPETAVSLAVLPVLTGRISVTNLRMSAPRLILDRNDQAAEETSDGTLAVLAGVLLQAPTLGDTLPRIEVVDPQVVPGVVVAGAGSESDAAALDLTGITITLDPAIGGAQRARLDITATRAPIWHLWVEVAATERGARFEAGLEDLLLDEIVLPDQWAGRVPPLSGPVSGRASGAVSQEHGLETAEATLSIGAGYVPVTTEAGFLLDGADIALRWNGLERLVHVEPSTIKAGRSVGVLSGRILVPEAGSVDYGLLPFKLLLDDAVLAAGNDVDPLPIDAVRFEGIYVEAESVLQVDRFDLASPEAAISVAARVEWEGQSPRIRGRGSFAEMPVDVLKRLWPDNIGRDAYDWVAVNFHSGTISFADFLIDIPSGALADMAEDGLPASALTLWLAVEDAVFTVVGDVPPMHAPHAEARMNLDLFEVVLAQPGRIDFPDATDDALSLDVPEGRMVIHDIDADIPWGVINVGLSGPAESLFQLMTYPPFDEVGAPDAVPGSVAGAMQAGVSVELPMRDDVLLADTKIGADVALSGFGMDMAGVERSIRNGEIALSITNERVAGEGAAEVNGVDAEIAFTEPVFGTGIASTQNVSLTLDAAARERFGIDLTGLLYGTVPAEFTDEDGIQVVTADLTGASLTFEDVGLDKPAGEPAQGVFEVSTGPGEVHLDRFEVTGRGMEIAGRMVLDETGDLVEASFNQFSLQEGDSLVVDAMATAPGRYRVVASGARFDFRRVLQTLLRESDPDSGDELALDFTLDVAEARGFNGETLRDLSVVLSHDGSDLSALDLTARHPDGTQLSARLIADSPEQPVLVISGGNAGALLRWLDIYTDIQGGDLELTARLDPASDTAAGSLTISRFRIAGNEELETLIRSTETEAQFAPGQTATMPDRPDPGSVSFEALEVAFLKGREQVTLRNGILRSPAIGATFEGAIDTRRDRVALTGTYVPLYALNNLFGQLPIIGVLLGGGQREGLLGITYRLAGPMDDPQVTVNPLSLITPGLFRNIFGVAPPVVVPAEPLAGGGQTRDIPEVGTSRGTDR
ncbi:MAG: AsmA-like C-terminal region-containing protein, partial [Pseudomonadota bacterium]